MPGGQDGAKPVWPEPAAPSPSPDLEQVAALRGQGLSYRAIAKKLGLGAVTRTLQARSKT